MPTKTQLLHKCRFHGHTFPKEHFWINGQGYYECREARAGCRARYELTAKAVERFQRYNATERGAARWVKYDMSEIGRARFTKYTMTEKADARNVIWRINRAERKYE